METVPVLCKIPRLLKIFCRIAAAYWMVAGLMCVQAASPDECTAPVARIVSLQGIVEFHRPGITGWRRVVPDTTFCAGDRVRVRSNSRAALRLSNESTLRLDQKTAITIVGPQADHNTLLDLMNGVMHVITRTPQPFRIRTPVMNASVEGTEFLIDTSSIADQSPQARIVVYEGQVEATNSRGSLTLTDQEVAIIHDNQPPRKTVTVQPLDAVQWALYYPVLIDYRPGSEHTGQLPSILQNAIRYYRQGKPAEALAELDHLTVEAYTADSLIFRAGLLLTVGRVQVARSDLQQVQAREPGNSEALSLLAIIAVVQHRKEEAFSLANQAVENDPASPVARLALSFVQQAHFQIEAALSSAEEATRLDPQHALTWARLAELQMSVGQLDQALQSAKQAVSLDPDLSRTQTVLGFAYLLQIDPRQAQATFTRAISLDQADPMPRLGRGIAQVRENKLEAGRIDIETAASLDPANSLIRSYLGKTYFEEKRYPLASTQFDLARERDPNDPTPWLYDAIQKQTQNCPVEALHDIQKSIELNDNRAVYRSQLLLDQDEAARGSSLARIYDNLGFEKRALMETAKSLSFDPSSHSAHRFLSDAYVNIPRHEIARVSELLQAQLLQPINVNPVQPRMAIADLNLITGTGPAALGFNEFTPLMERNKAQLIASGIYGSHGTRGDEVVLSGVYDRASVSFGQFHYQSDGFRFNNDQTHNIYNAFMQYAVTPKFNIQAELRRRETKHGDLLMDFDPENFSSDYRRKLDEDVARIGARYALASNQDLIFSGKYIDRSELIDFTVENSEESSLKGRNKGFQVEAQHIFRKNNFNSIIGGKIYRIGNDGETDIPDMNGENTYLYTHANFVRNVNATFALSYDSFLNRLAAPYDSTTRKINPKLGLQWNITDSIRLRAAWLNTTKLPLIAQQTLEPTQVAGFNQFYDDINGTRSRRTGIGLDVHPANKWYTGIEISERKLKVPYETTDATGLPIEKLQHQTEWLYRGYLYWIPDIRWAVRLEPQLEKFERSKKNILYNLPSDIDTFSIPASLAYFDPSGFFARLAGTYVWQNVERNVLGADSSRLPLKAGTSSFFLMDAVLGFRLPKRRGMLSMEIRNLLDKKFLFRHMNFYESEATTSRFIPGRTIFARVTLNF